MTGHSEEHPAIGVVAEAGSYLYYRHYFSVLGSTARVNSAAELPWLQAIENWRKYRTFIIADILL